MNDKEYINEYEKMVMGFTRKINRFMKREWESENYKEKLEEMINGLEVEASNLFKNRREN